MTTSPAPDTERSPLAPSQGPVLSRFARDPIIRPLLDDFVKDLLPFLTELQKAQAGANWTQLSRLGHKLKGEAATYGYPDLAALASKLEERTAAPQPPQPDDIAALMSAMEAMTQRVVAGLAT